MQWRPKRRYWKESAGNIEGGGQRVGCCKLRIQRERSSDHAKGYGIIMETNDGGAQARGSCEGGAQGLRSQSVGKSTLDSKGSASVEKGTIGRSNRGYRTPTPPGKPVHESAEELTGIVWKGYGRSSILRESQGSEHSVSDYNGPGVL